MIPFAHIIDKLLCIHIKIRLLPFSNLLLNPTKQLTLRSCLFSCCKERTLLTFQHLWCSCASLQINLGDNLRWLRLGDGSWLFLFAELGGRLWSLRRSL